jgi:hypothetical protein
LTEIFAYRWDGCGMQVLPRFAKAADKKFTVGEIYVLEEIQERSAASHRHFFASVRQAWLNLPERLVLDFPSAEHLRKFALVRAGFYNRRSIAAKSPAEAAKIAAFIRPMDEFAVVTVDGNIINVFTAKSQNYREMDKKEFAASKDAVLRILEDLLRVEEGGIEKAGVPA